MSQTIIERLTFKDMRGEQVRPREHQVNSCEDVDRCVEYLGLESIAFIDWTTNTIFIYDRCQSCNAFVDYSKTHCLLCWMRGACETGENYEGDE